MVVNPDGTGLRRLTRTDGDGDPSWSPDGAKVAFARLNSDTCDCERIWVVNADGTGEQPLTSVEEDATEPAWSPDGKRIAFAKRNLDRESDSNKPEVDIYVMNPDGSEMTRLTDLAGVEQDPSWSPDGNQIAFEAEQGDPTETYVGSEIFVMNADGSELRPLTDTVEDEFFPAWSPDGDTIAFERRGDDGITIVLVNEDGSGERELRAPNQLWFHPAWSPDGTQLAFITDDQEGIWVMDADGRNAHRVWSAPSSEPMNPDWAAARE
jgi:Tol biopolymer transport system component